MSSLLRALLAAACFFGPVASRAIAAESSDGPGQRIDVAHDPEFPRAAQVMARLVKHDRMGGAANSFCVVGYRDGADEIAWVYWSNRHALILWEPQTAPVADLSTSRRRLDLRRDVVPGERDLRGSTFRVTQPWVDRVIGDCQAIGLKISLPRKIS